MRIILALLASITMLSAAAQTGLPVGGLDYMQWRPLPHHLLDSNASGRKWQLSKYAGLSAGTIIFGGSASYISAPLGLQLTRQLNNNLYGFAGASVAPTFFSFNSLYAQPVSNTGYPGLQKGYGLGLSSRVEAGLMWVNDAKTFSISGSVGIERGSYPVYSPGRTSTKKQ